MRRFPEQFGEFRRLMQGPAIQSVSGLYPIGESTMRESRADSVLDGVQEMVRL